MNVSHKRKGNNMSSPFNLSSQKINFVASNILPNEGCIDKASVLRLELFTRRELRKVEAANITVWCKKVCSISGAHGQIACQED